MRDDPCTAQSLRHIAPGLRATASVICDADVTQLPYCEAIGADPEVAVPGEAALRCVTTALNESTPLEAAAYDAFCEAYKECRRHLHVLPASVLAQDGMLSRALVRTMRLDHYCIEAGLVLPHFFPQIIELHDYLLSLHASEAQPRVQGSIYERLMQFLCDVLDRAHAVLVRYAAAVEGDRHGGGTDVNERAFMARIPRTGSAMRQARERAARHQRPSQLYQFLSYAEATAGAQTALTPAQERRSFQHAFDVIVTAAPDELAASLCRVNGQLRLQLAHLRWYVELLLLHAVSFSADDHLEDLTMRKAWATHVGRSRAACSVAEFMPVLQAMVPPWCAAVVLRLVDLNGCGVVSLYSVTRLLRLWGPLSLLAHNLAVAGASRSFAMGESYEYVVHMFHRRPAAAPGDYVATLTENIGEVRVVLLYTPVSNGLALLRRHSRRGSNSTSSMTTAGVAEGLRRGSHASSATVTLSSSSSSLYTIIYQMLQHNGAWTVNGVTKEAFESVLEACEAFSSVLRRPCGEAFDVAAAAPPAPSLTSLPTTDTNKKEEEEDENNDGAERPAMGRALAKDSRYTARLRAGAVQDGASALHFACFRNQIHYVKLLLERGAGTIINTVLQDDDAISPGLGWTPLLCAVNSPSADPALIVRDLLLAGADAAYADEADCTALYYAIANGYAETTRVLLTHAPQLRSSLANLPLLVALGAHHFHLRQGDIRRLAELLPSPAMCAALAPYITNYALLTLAIDILQDKLAGKDKLCSSAEMRDWLVACIDSNGQGSTTSSSLSSSPSDAAAALGRDELSVAASYVELRTREEEAALAETIHSHTRLCQRHEREVRAALKELRRRCYVLSWRDWLARLGARPRDDVN